MASKMTWGEERELYNALIRANAASMDYVVTGHSVTQFEDEHGAFHVHTMRAQENGPRVAEECPVCGHAWTAGDAIKANPRT